MHLCAHCHRHIRETRCPFCATEQTNARPIGSAVRSGVKRAALIVTAAGLAACASDVSPNDDASARDAASDVREDRMSVALPYGVPARDAGEDVSSIDPYGIPPDDGGR